MKIAILGSMTFAKQMKQIESDLKKLSHEAIAPIDTEMCIANPLHIDNLDADYKHCVENNVMKKQFEIIENSDAVLVLNYPKNGIDGYVGTASLMELGLAHHFNKKIFLLHDLPHSSKARWAHEVKIMQPTILNGNLKKIV